MMQFTPYVPPPPLGDFVELLWTFHGGATPWTQERLLPQGTTELVIDLETESFDGVVAGPHSRYFVLDTSQPRSLVGVHFKPGGAFPFVPPPLYELSNAVVPLDALWGNLAYELRDRLGDAQTDKECFAIVERVLLERAGSRLAHHPAVAYALRQFTRVPHRRTVAEVTAQIGLSQRRFIELFTREVGLAPKVFCRVRRFQAAVAAAHRARPDWTAVALDCGYFDQAHFIHDFEEFSGLTPSAWAAQRTEHVNHVPIRD